MIGHKSKDEFYFQPMPYTVGELVYMYETTYRKFREQIRRHQRKIGKRIGYSYSAKQVEIMFHCIGEPVRPLPVDKEEWKEIKFSYLHYPKTVKKEEHKKTTIRKVTSLNKNDNR